VVKKLERSIEQQTRVHPISIFKNRNYITAGDLAQLILCWRIIHRRIFIETTQESHVRSENTSEKEE
jgi:phosphoribulokinase